jgi:hypothetical protein
LELNEMSYCHTRRSFLTTLTICLAAGYVSGCIVQTDTGDDGTGGAGGSASSGAGAGTPEDATRLFVVNNNAELTSYAGAAALDGETPPTTRLSLGASTSLFQPRDVALTAYGRLLVARQNGGIVGYDDGLAADAETAASVVVEGTDTGLDSPVTMALASASDTLYVGGPQLADGVLVYDAVSSDAFDGNVPPTRTFGPTDRAPHDPDGTIQLSIDAMVLDATGSLFFSDTSGDDVNHSRVLFYDDPAAQSGASEPDAVFTSAAWSRIEDMAIDGTGTLFVVDATDTVFVYEAADTLEGEVQPSRTVGIPLGGVSLTGLALSSTGLGYVADDMNHAIYTLDAIATLDGNVEPLRTLAGFETRLRNPRKMLLVEP